MQSSLQMSTGAPIWGQSGAFKDQRASTKTPRIRPQMRHPTQTLARCPDVFENAQSETPSETYLGPLAGQVGDHNAPAAAQAYSMKTTLFMG